MAHSFSFPTLPHELKKPMWRYSEKAAQKESSVAQEESSYQKMTLLDLALGTSNLQNCEKVSVCCLSPPHFEMAAQAD